MPNYAGIWIGLPDASYAQITPVAARRILTSNDLDGAEPAFARYATSLSAEMTLVEALQKSLARYQGADAGESGAWALVHARAIRDYASMLAAQLDQTVASMQLMRFVFDSDPRPIDAQIAVLKEWRDRVAADGGFSVAELREAANLGLSAEPALGMRPTCSRTTGTSRARPSSPTWTSSSQRTRRSSRRCSPSRRRWHR